MTHDSYFTIQLNVFTSQILAESMFHESYRVYLIMVLKLTNKYQIIPQCHNFKNILLTIIHFFM